MQIIFSISFGLLICATYELQYFVKTQAQFSPEFGHCLLRWQNQPKNYIKICDGSWTCLIFLADNKLTYKMVNGIFKRNRKWNHYFLWLFSKSCQKKIIGRDNVMALLKFNYLQDLRNLAQTLQEAYIFWKTICHHSVWTDTSCSGTLAYSISCDQSSDKLANTIIVSISFILVFLLSMMTRKHMKASSGFMKTHCPSSEKLVVLSSSR